jgi:hypothetical protein
MLELADIVRRYGAAYRAGAGGTFAQPRAALRDVGAVAPRPRRPPQQCDQCGQRLYGYHLRQSRLSEVSRRADRALAGAQPHTAAAAALSFTFTLPAALRALARSHRRYCTRR